MPAGVRQKRKDLNTTDLEVLEALSDGKRNISANTPIDLDGDRVYLNTRFPILFDRGLVRRVGRSERSDLYEITREGQLVLGYSEEYRGPHVDFLSFIAEQFPE